MPFPPPSGGGTVVSPGAGIAINDGTISLAPITSHDILANAHGTSDVPAAVPLGSGVAIDSNTSLVARQAVRMQAEWVTGALVTNDTIYFAYDPPYDGTINSMTHFCNTGSFTVAVKIAGVNVTGLAAVTPTSTPTTTNATAANTFTAGQIISGVITGTALAPTDALLSLNVKWTG